MSSLKVKSPRKHPAQRWILTRKALQYFALAFFILLFIAAPHGGRAAWLVHGVMHLDPLLVLANVFASRALAAGAALALVTIVLTLVFGRAWCGWLCPLGTVLDLFSLNRWRGKGTPPAESWRGAKYFLLIAILSAALLGNLALLFFDPLTLLFRTLTASLLPTLDQLMRRLESFLFQAPFLSEAIANLDAWLRPRLLPVEPLFFQAALFFAIIFLALILLNLFAPRFWCRYLCPLGAMLGVIAKFSLYRREVAAECTGCGLCEKACPTGTIDPEKNYASDPGECTMCLDCLEACPRSRVAFRPGISMADWNDYDPNRRKALGAIGITLLGVGLVHTNPAYKRLPNHLVRPPGAIEANTDILEMTRCIRCGACLRVCPTGGLQPAVFEAGLGGFGSPLLAPRLGYCDFSCNACGQVCPAEAIPPLSLEEKRLRVIGTAAIDKNRCLPWADGIPCVICEEMCPLPEKAIQLEEAQAWDASGELKMVQRPHVLGERCIGCGICENKCPLAGEAAIRVYTPQSLAT